MRNFKKLKEELIDLKKKLEVVFSDLGDCFSTFSYTDNESWWDTKNSEDLGASIENLSLDIDALLEEELNDNKKEVE